MQQRKTPSEVLMTIFATPDEAIALGDAILARIRYLQQHEPTHPALPLLQRFQHRLVEQREVQALWRNT
jgi:hypothetical protein